MTPNTNAKTRFRVVERTFDGMDEVTEPTTLRLVLSGVVVATMLLAAFVFGW